jgi:hypothetical protein
MPASYRPWGDLLWLLDKLPQADWFLLGCLGTETRSLAAWKQLKLHGLSTQSRLARIQEPIYRFDGKTQARKTTRHGEYYAGGGTDQGLADLSLFTTAFMINSLVTTLTDSQKRDVVLDISSLPKRFFFPLLKTLVNCTAVQNLVVTYAVPVSYTDEALAEDFGDWRSLPSFGGLDPSVTPDTLIVNVGHLPMGLPDQVLHGPRMDVNLLFPFPNLPSSYRRTWDFLWTIERELKNETVAIRHVSPVDVSDAFDHICAVTEMGAKSAMFAPYGPKPISLAMCLYAMLKDDPVFYTQPRVYHPDYSLGTANEGGADKIWAYLVKHNGTSAYRL